MKASKYLVPTEKEDPQDAVVASHKLMIRAGLIRKSASGLYSYLPFGLKILKKIEKIIREEMDHSGALEFELPILTPSEYWIKSGRWDKMGPEMIRVKDRHGVDYCLGPTHEESFSSLLQPMMKSYKDLPINVYQMHTKFRDEIRPRFGVIRSREFRMKDAYSFHLDDNSLDETYETMRKVYRNIFRRCGLATIPVQADSGNMGGSASEEFMVVSPIGEETLAICSQCGYSSNTEKTPVLYKPEMRQSSAPEKNKVHTPGKKTIEEVAGFLKIEEHHFIKAIALKTDENKKMVVFLAGDRELNEHKLKNLTGAGEFIMMSNDDLVEEGLVPGFIGPLAMNKNITFFFDVSIHPDSIYVTGANETDYHFENFILSRECDLSEKIYDLSKSKSGDPCPDCGKPLSHEKGIEVGHIFKLGDKYTKAFNINVLDEKGKARSLTMGCYGIGVNRTMATVIEQNNDEKGIYWPITIAPFEICMVSISKTEEDYVKLDAIYSEMVSKNLEVFWDDRNLGPGFKFKDAELIGFPLRITFGKKFFESGEYSIMIRKTGEEKPFQFSTIDAIVNNVQELRNELLKELL